LLATVEKSEVSAPNRAGDTVDNKHVQTTYGYVRSMKTWCRLSHFYGYRWSLLHHVCVE
jgi:hypothetical protein